MNTVRVAMDVKVVAGEIGTPLSKTGDYIDKWVEIGGTFNATLVLEGTIGGSDWAEVATVFEPTLVEVLPAFSSLRVRTSAFASGAPTAVFSGRDARGITQLPTRF